VVQRSRNGGDKLNRVAVGFFQAKPGNGQRTASAPPGDERRLAITSRCADKQQPMLAGESVVEAMVEAGTQRQVMAQARWV